MLGTVKKEVLQRLQVEVTGQVNEFCSSVGMVLTVKINFCRTENTVNERVQTVWTEKMSDFHHVQQKQKFFILL